LKIRKHFRTDTSVVDYIITDLNVNIVNKEDCLDRCVAERITKLNNEYNRQLDRVITYIILRCDFEDLPIQAISKITLSLTKVMDIMNKGFISIIGED